MAPLLAVEGLKTHIFTRAGVVKAVDGVSFSVGEGEVLGASAFSGATPDYRISKDTLRD